MRSRLKSYSPFIGSLVAVLGVVLLSNCSSELAHEGKVIFTQFPVNSIDAEQINLIENKYAPDMKIAIAELSEELEEIEVLTKEFHSARAPEISYDGSILLFSAQKAKADAWQIWTMSLESGDIAQVTDSRTNCTDPTWLPNGHIAFSKLVTDEKSLKYHALYTIGADGCCEQRITFQPHEDVNANVMHDGRILVASKQVFPEEGSFKYLALRPDGTKAEVFHLANEKTIGKAIEMNDMVVFPESDLLSSVKFSRPLNTHNILSDKYIVNSVHNLGNYNLVITGRKTKQETFGLAMYNIDDIQKEIIYHSDPENHITEAVVVSQRSVPRKLPSRVDLKQNSGFFFSMNTDASDIEVEGKTRKVQVLGMNELIGETPVAEDGSFYLELTADRPIRFQTLDDSGRVLRGPSSWLWVRPNERRGCAGCHQDREIAPDNVVPKAMEKAPFAMIR